ncbi:CE1759 family FMN reductase [Actinomyces minihominis]|uniref:CE1759 family FMN reductase n=1 Tax=Actinomyces minihominis TaxID=2002838 RepID=UPI000C08CE45|nr:CE1759 family FMN reductase [Actinomyces minihominis]
MQARKIVIVSAGTSEQSTTTELGVMIAREVEHELEAQGVAPSTSLIKLRDHARDIAGGIGSGIRTDSLNQALDSLIDADVVIAATPVYKAGMSGLFTSFWDLVDDDAVLGTPVILAATAGTPRHGLVPDELMRGLFAYLRSIAVPTSVFAATEDLAAPASLRKRSQRAAVEAAVLVSANVREQIRGRSDGGYRRSFRTDGHAPIDPTDSLDFDSDLMKLAAGGLG